MSLNTLYLIPFVLYVILFAFTQNKSNDPNWTKSKRRTFKKDR